MDGLGFLIWQLAKMPAPAALANFLAEGKVRWVSIKTLDGVNLYNAKNNNQKLLKEYWAAIEEKGIEVGAWHRVYGEQPGAEGDAALAFQEEFDPKHFLIDAEGEMKRYGAAKSAKAYCEKLHNGRCFVALCSYRFPSQHKPILKPFPFAAYLNHEKVDGTAPQVYWIGSHNVGIQVQDSLNEYRALTSKPFIPIGSSFGYSGWEPTKGDLLTFVAVCKELKFSAYGFYSLDYILEKKRMDWWQTITGQVPPPPPPPEITDHEKVERMWLEMLEHNWNP